MIFRSMQFVALFFFSFMASFGFRTVTTFKLSHTHSVMYRSSSRPVCSRAISRLPQITLPTSSTHTRLFQSNENAGVVSGNTTSSSLSDEITLLVEKVKEEFSHGELLTMEMTKHRPLGCTVEESLHNDFHVFISRITEGGNADKAGLMVGDVVVGVTGLFGDLTIVMGYGVEKITRLVTAVPEEQSLSMQIVRGTNVLELHESAIVDLCNMSGASDKEVENCVVDFLSGGYDIEDEATNEDKEFLAEQFSSDDDLIDRVMNLWADEVPPPHTTSGITDPVNGSNIAKKRPKPWSSRSSGSGTWVRDPKTGVMRNIDS